MRTPGDWCLAAPGFWLEQSLSWILEEGRPVLQAGLSQAARGWCTHLVCPVYYKMERRLVCCGLDWRGEVCFSAVENSAYWGQSLVGGSRPVLGSKQEQCLRTDFGTILTSYSALMLILEL